jgi:hypothetical protein
MAGPLQFGISITPDWSKQDEVFALARAADASGLDLIGIQDHPYQCWGGPRSACAEARNPVVSPCAWWKSSSVVISPP